MNQTEKPVAHLICGFIGSGKTTFARKLEKETGAARFTKDEWMVKLFGNNPPKESFLEYDAKMTELATEMALKCLVAGGSVIIDDGFWYRKQRDEIRQKLQALEVESRLYYVKATVDLMKERTIRRSENPPEDSFYITEQEFDDYLQLFQPPSDNEVFISVRGEVISTFHFEPIKTGSF